MAATSDGILECAECGALGSQEHAPECIGQKQLVTGARRHTADQQVTCCEACVCWHKSCEDTWNCHHPDMLGAAILVMPGDTAATGVHPKCPLKTGPLTIALKP